MATGPAVNLHGHSRPEPHQDLAIGLVDKPVTHPDRPGSPIVDPLKLVVFVFATGIQQPVAGLSVIDRTVQVPPVRISPPVDLSEPPPPIHLVNRVLVFLKHFGRDSNKILVGVALQDPCPDLNPFGPHLCRLPCLLNKGSPGRRNGKRRVTALRLNGPLLHTTHQGFRRPAAIRRGAEGRPPPRLDRLALPFGGRTTMDAGTHGQQHAAGNSQSSDVHTKPSTCNAYGGPAGRAEQKENSEQAAE